MLRYANLNIVAVDFLRASVGFPKELHKRALFF